MKIKYLKGIVLNKYKCDCILTGMTTWHMHNMLGCFESSEFTNPLIVSVLVNHAEVCPRTLEIHLT